MVRCTTIATTLLALLPGLAWPQRVRIVGFVTDRTDWIIPNALVTLKPAGMETGKVVATTTSDTRGYFEFTDLPRQLYDLEVLAGGLPRALLRVDARDRDLVPLERITLGISGSRGEFPPLPEAEIVAGEPVSIAGLARDNCARAPLPYAEIWLQHDATAVVKTGPNGRFSFLEVPRGRYSVGLKHGSTTYWSRQVINTAEGKDLDLGSIYFDLTLPGLCDVVEVNGLPANAPAAMPVVGRVTTPAGYPISKARITTTRGQRDRTTTNKNGRFALHDVRPGRYELLLEADGFRPLRKTIDVEYGAMQLDLGDVELHRARRHR